jgi:hypothetical protein
MKINGNTQIPNWIVYVVLYGIVFGISIWLLVAQSESPTNWQVNVLLIAAVLSGAILFARHSWNQKRPAQDN